MSLFFDMLDGETNKVVTETSEDENIYITEAAPTQSLPYIKMMRKKYYLPIGKPTGRGCICYLYTTNLQESIDIMRHVDDPFEDRHKYTRYFYPTIYNFRLHNKLFRIRDIDVKKDNHIKIAADLPYIRGMPKYTFTSSDVFNTYYDLYRYVEIIMEASKNLSPSIFVPSYWNIFKPIYEDKLNGNFDTRFVIVNMENFTLSTKLKDNLKNPLFMMYYTLYKYRDTVKSLNLDFYFYNKNKVLKINPSLCDEKSYIQVRQEMKRLVAGISSQSSSVDKATDDVNITSQELIEEPKQDILNDIVKTDDITINSVEDLRKITKNEEETNKEITSKINIIVDDSKNKVAQTLNSNINKLNASLDTKKDNAEVSQDDNTSDDDKIQEKIIKKAIKDKAEEEISSDKELISKIYNDINKDKPKSTFSSARDEELRREQKNIMVKDMTVKDISKIKANDIKIEEKDVSNALTTPNEDLKKIKFNNFEKTYNEKLMTKDIINNFLALNDKSIPMYVLKVDVKDTSDVLNYKETYTILFEDANRKRHTLKVDVPKFMEDKFLYIGGNKKIIKHQSFFYPVVKVSEDTVQVVTNYSKIIIHRNERKSVSAIERFKILIKRKPELNNSITFGNSHANNREFVTTLEYDDLSKFINKFKHGNVEIFFDQMELSKKEYPHKNGYLCIGTENNKPIYIDTESQVDSRGRSIVDIMVQTTSDDIKEEFERVKPGKVLATAQGAIMEQDVKIGILLSFWDGFIPFISKLGVEYRLEDKKPSTLESNENYIEFKDCVFVYKETVAIALLLNGLRELNTSDFTIVEMNNRSSYAGYLLKRYGNATIENALLNFYEFMIDPITKEILIDKNMPTDIVSLVIYAVKLLADSQFTPEINQGQSRIRSNEIVAAILYSELARGYLQYRNSSGRKKLTVKQDCVIKEILAQKTVENYSTLNPFLEMQMTSAVSTKGFRGANLDRSYTLQKRMYDESMIGTISPVTSPDANAGVAKYLSTEPAVSNIRGYVDTPKNQDYSKYTDVNLFSPSELCIPLADSLDDPTRLGHSAKQSSHVIPVKNASPVLISNGMEEAARFHLSSDFVVNAKEAGTVIDYDEKAEVMVVEYKSGKRQAISLSSNIVNNANGGFFLANKLITKLKVGDKFKENDVLAYHKDFFTSDAFNNCRLNVGPLVKIAITSSYNTYEDATFITHKFSEDAATEMCFCKSVVVGKNSNVEYIVKKGDHITVGDKLISFDTSYDDDSLNSLLANMGDEEKDLLLESSKNDIVSKYSGIIEDVKIYAAVDLEEMSPTLRKIVSDRYREINHKKNFVAKYDHENANSVVVCGMFMTEQAKKINPDAYGVIKGEKAEDSVLFEFYIKHSEPLEVGSKIANFTALKNTIAQVIEKGYEPFSEFRPDEEIGTIIASNSILNRMTGSILYTALGYKDIIELKRSLKTIWDKYPKKEEALSDMKNLIYKFFSAMDKSGTNTKYYKERFEGKSNTFLVKYFKEFFEDDKAYLILHVKDYDHSLSMEEIEAGAKVLGIPLFEYVSMPHLTMDKSHVVVTKKPVPVGYICEKRTQQSALKKNGMSTSISQRSAMTGQVTAKDKNGRSSDVENNMLISMGLINTMKELNGPRSDDLVMKEEMLRDIAMNGYASLSDLTDDIYNKTALNLVDTYFLGMSLKTDLVTKGLMTKQTLNKEI